MGDAEGDGIVNSALPPGSKNDPRDANVFFTRCAMPILSDGVTFTRGGTDGIFSSSSSSSISSATDDRPPSAVFHESDSDGDAVADRRWRMLALVSPGIDTAGEGRDCVVACGEVTSSDEVGVPPKSFVRISSEMSGFVGRRGDGEALTTEERRKEASARYTNEQT